MLRGKCCGRSCCLEIQDNLFSFNLSFPAKLIFFGCELETSMRYFVSLKLNSTLVIRRRHFVAREKQIFRLFFSLKQCSCLDWKVAGFFLSISNGKFPNWETFPVLSKFSSQTSRLFSLQNTEQLSEGKYLDPNDSLVSFSSSLSHCYIDVNWMTHTESDKRVNKLMPASEGYFNFTQFFLPWLDLSFFLEGFFFFSFCAGNWQVSMNSRKELNQYFDALNKDKGCDEFMKYKDSDGYWRLSI